MNPSLFRSLARPATKMALSGSSRSAVTNWAVNLLGVSAVLGAGAAIVAWDNNDKNSHIRKIFKNERAMTKTPHN